ncbi:Myoglobin [Diplonema papillatum]|nr:Myoglobin [Diplonema papillatum]
MTEYPHHGIVEPVADCLPGPFAAWDALAVHLPALNKSGLLAAAVDGLPVLSARGKGKAAGLLLSPPEARRSYVILSFAATAFLNAKLVDWSIFRDPAADETGKAAARRWLKSLPADQPGRKHVDVQQEEVGPCPLLGLIDKPQARRVKEGATVLPLQLSLPYAQVCAALGIRPCITPTAADVWNFGCGNWLSAMTFLLPGAHRGAAKRAVASFTGSLTELGFHGAPHLMHRAAEGVFPAALSLAAALGTADPASRPPAATVAAAVFFLQSLRELFKEFVAIFKAVLPSIDPRVFYDGYRPLFTGSHPQTEAVLFEGVGWVSCKGPSAGQNVLFVVVDVLLGFQHTPDVREFQEEILEYVPEAHRALYHEVKRRLDGTDLARFVESSGDEQLKVAYDQTVRAVRHWRRFHMAVAVRYLPLATTGTGSTTFRDLLNNAAQAPTTASKL